MNILPKKRWHVRTKENIARVRRDEAQAAEEEKERLRKVALAEQEFRTATLRRNAAERRGAISETSIDEKAKPELDTGDAQSASIVGPSGHINFFQHLEAGERTAGPNEEYLREQKEEKEKYEKSIGYLTYLGQGSREETKQKAWFETLPTDRRKERDTVAAEEVKRKAKELEDPLQVVKKLVGTSEDASSVKSVKPAVPASLPAPSPRPSSVKETALVRKRNRSSRSDDERSVKRRRQSSSDDDERRVKRSRRMKHKKREKHEKREKKRKHRKEKKRKKSSSERHTKSMKTRRSSPSLTESSSSTEDEDAEAEAAKKIQLERLRAERLQREREERERANKLLRKLRGDEEPAEKKHAQEPRLKQRYNAQFNPYLARQNYRDS